MINLDLYFLWRFRKCLSTTIVLINTAVGKIIIQLSYLVKKKKGYICEAEEMILFYYNSVLKLIQLLGGFHEGCFQFWR